MLMLYDEKLKFFPLPRHTIRGIMVDYENRSGVRNMSKNQGTPPDDSDLDTDLLSTYAVTFSIQDKTLKLRITWRIQFDNA